MRIIRWPVPRRLAVGQAIFSRPRIYYVPEFIIERNMPGVGSLDGAKLQAASQTSCTVLRKLGPNIQWVQSYVTPDKIFCVYRAPSEDLIRQHAKQAGFPAHEVARAHARLDQSTAA